MSNKSTQVLLVVMLVCVVYNSWTVATLRADIKRSSNTQSSAPHVDLGQLNAPLLQIQQNQVSAQAALSYNEMLTEGLVRKAGLPIEEARAVFEKREPGLPSGWTWLSVWEATPEPTPPE